MSEQHPSRQESRSLETLNLVLQLCDEFEDAWVWGNRPDLAVFLQRVPDAMRDKVLPHLLELEIELRRAADEAPHIDEYLARFAEHKGGVRDVFARIMM